MSVSSFSWQSRTGGVVAATPAFVSPCSPLSACHLVPFNSSHFSPLSTRQGPIGPLSLAKGCFPVTGATWGLQWGSGTAPRHVYPLASVTTFCAEPVSETLPRAVEATERVGGVGAEQNRERRPCRPPGSGDPPRDTGGARSWIPLLPLGPWPTCALAPALPSPCTLIPPPASSAPFPVTARTHSGVIAGELQGGAPRSSGGSLKSWAQTLHSSGRS